MGKSLKYGSHSFPASAGFTGSSGKVQSISPYTRRVPKPVSKPGKPAGPVLSPGASKGLFASTAAPAMGNQFPKPKVAAPKVPAPLGHSLVHRAKPVTQEDARHGGKSPLLPGFKRGGKVEKC